MAGGPRPDGRPSTLPGRGAGRPAQRPAHVGNLRAGRGAATLETRSQRLDRYNVRATSIRGRQAVYLPRYGFWRNNPYWARWRITRPYRWATWAALTGWFGWRATNSGVYYDYGGNVYYDYGSVYIDDQPVATYDEYAEQAESIAATGNETLEAAPDDEQWMSLGVFALADQEDGDPTMFFQLAVAKDGTIAGTYYNTQSEQTLPVQGAVDAETQRAAWTIGDNSETVFETGIYNLTQDETAVLIHFTQEQRDETWLLVRMDEPDDEME